MPICPLKKTGIENPSALCVSTKKRQYTYQQFDQVVAQLTSRLKFYGITKNDHVVLCGRVSVEYVAVLFALFRMGAIACLVNERQPAQSLVQQMSLLGSPKYIAFDSNEVLKNLFRAGECIFMPDILANLNSEPLSIQDSLSDIDLAKPASIIFTSGSAGQPKAVVLSLENNIYSALGSNEHLPFGAGDIWGLSLPLYHVSGLGIIFRAFCGGGGVLIPEPEETPAEWLLKYPLTHISLVPTQMYRLLAEPQLVKRLRSLKAILLGGGLIPDQIIKMSLVNRLPLFLSYGLSEMSSQVATSFQLTPENPEPRFRILRYRQMRLSEDGEFWVRGETLFKGYWRAGALERPLTNDGWFATGDRGTLSADGATIQLGIHGRKDRMFIRGGENIFPEEIERCLLNFTGIRRVYVLGKENPEFGAVPIAFVQFETTPSPRRESIIQYLRQQLVPYKIPVEFYVWPESGMGQGIKLRTQDFLRYLQDPQLQRLE